MSLMYSYCDYLKKYYWKYEWFVGFLWDRLRFDIYLIFKDLETNVTTIVTNSYQLSIDRKVV